MTKQAKTRVQLLIGLLVVLGVTLGLGYRLTRPAVPVASAAEGEQKPANPLPAQSDARIRLDLLGPPDTTADIGKNNVFQYRAHVAPEVPTGANGMPLRPGAMTPPPPPPPITRVAPSLPSGPPPPPPIPLKYFGFAKIGPAGKVLTAVLFDNSQHPFHVVADDVIMGRYRVVHISETAVEIEDLELNRHQTIMMEKPQ